MVENNNFNNVDNQEEGGINLVEWFFKCLNKWHWFVISIVACIAVAYVYTRYQTPQYNISASVLIKEKDKRSGQADALMAMQDMGMFSVTSSFDNELEILKSRTLVKSVVTDLKLYINNYKDNKFGYNTPLYHNEPLTVFITPEDAVRFEKGARLETTIRTNGKISVKLEYEIGDQEYEFDYEYEQLPAVISTGMESIFSGAYMNVSIEFTA